MKKLFKTILTIIGVAYFAVILVVTGCLLSYNQFKVTQISDKTLIIIDNKSDKYTDGDLVVFTKNPNDEITNGSEIFFYEVSRGTVSVKSGNVTKSQKVTDTETTFTINGNHEISSEMVIGKTQTATVYHNIGKILYVFESRYGFLLLVILPALLFFFYEIYRLIVEIKTPSEDAKEETIPTNTASNVISDMDAYSRPNVTTDSSIETITSNDNITIPQQPVAVDSSNVDTNVLDKTVNDNEEAELLDVELKSVLNNQNQESTNPESEQ